MTAAAPKTTAKQPNVVWLFASAFIVPAIVIALLLIPGGTEPPEPAPRPADERSDVQGAIDGLAEAVFGAYSEADKSAARTLDGYREFLDAAGLLDGGTLRLEGDRIFGGSRDSEPRFAAVRTALERRLAAAQAQRDRELRLRAFTVARDDGWEDTVLRIHAELMESDDFGRARIYERAYQVSGRPFDGFGFALLANNVNCILCHASFDNAARVHNTDVRARGTFARVRVGALESLHFREASACSRIAGSLYVRGSVTRKDGAPLTDLAATTISTVRFDEDGFLAEDDLGNLLGRAFEKALGDPPAPRATLYVDYPGTPEHQTDGPMPSSFPPPIPDVDGDRSVDGEEFSIVAATVNGRIDGGMKTLVAPGGVYDRPTIEPGEDFAASGVVSGNLVARGTLASPLRIDGRVAIDGDLVIEGVIRGSGVIFVRGNIYVTGPLIYADRRDAAYNRIFGTASDGKPNRLALAAGGSILIGNVLDKSEAQGAGAQVTGDTRGCMNFTISESMLFNRMEWSKTQAALPGQDGALVENPLYTPGYKARYYTLFAGSPVYVMNDGSKVDLYFDPASRSWRGFEAAFFWSSGGWSEYPLGHPELAGSRLLPLMPERWLSRETLEALWSDAASRHTPGLAFEVDGLLYTNNAVIFTAPKSSVYAASLLVNGAIVAADVGILAPGIGGVGMQLNYDARLDGLLTIRDVNDLTLVRGDRPLRLKRR